MGLPSFLALALLFLWVAASATRPALAAPAVTSNPLTDYISFDSNLFVSTVPSYAILGHNYTLYLLVTNTANKSVPVILRVDAPVQSVYTFPVYLHVLVAPESQILTNFTLIAFNLAKGPLNVTATMWVWFFQQMSRPVIAQQASTIIDGVVPSPESRMTEVLLAVVAVGAVVFAALYVTRKKGGLAS